MHLHGRTDPPSCLSPCRQDKERGGLTRYGTPTGVSGHGRQNVVLDTRSGEECV